MAKEICSHLDQIRDVHPHTRGCEECLALGDEWVHLRLCMTCGKVGCCDSSKNKHATRHFHATKHAIVTRIVTHRHCIAITRTRRKIRATAPGPGGGDFGFLRNATPSSGMKMTATSQDASTAMLTTAKIENVYSPAALLAKPIGTKPAIVTSEPVSIGNASVL